MRSYLLLIFALIFMGGCISTPTVESGKARIDVKGYVLDNVESTWKGATSVIGAVTRIEDASTGKVYYDMGQRGLAQTGVILPAGIYKVTYGCGLNAEYVTEDEKRYWDNRTETVKYKIEAGEHMVMRVNAFYHPVVPLKTDRKTVRYHDKTEPTLQSCEVEFYRQ